MNTFCFSPSNQPENPPPAPPHLTYIFSYFFASHGEVITPVSKRNISHSLFSLFWERSGCFPAPTPSAASQHPNVSFTSLRSEPGVQQLWKNGHLTCSLLSWALKAKSALGFIFGVPGEGLCALKAFKKGDVCFDDTTLFGDEDLPSILLSFHCKLFFLNVQMSWNWSYVRENLEGGTEEVSLFVWDLHSYNVPCCTRTGAY